MSKNQKHECRDFFPETGDLGDIFVCVCGRKWKVRVRADEWTYEVYKAWTRVLPWHREWYG